jgi:hypothetical protein
MVFNDYDANGVKNTAESTSGVGNVEIVAVDNTGVTYNTTTNNYGKYILGIPTANYPIRIEWTPPIGYGKGTQNGTNGKTSVQFVSSASCNIDFGLLQNNDYCQSNPKIVVPVFRTGDPSNATVGSLTALYRYDKTLTGAPAPASMDNLATIAQIGAVWGTVYDPLRNKIYTASVVRRHSAMGPLGIDGIYQTNLNAALPNASKLLEASDYSGVLVGTIETTANRNIVGPATSTSTDTSGWNAVGLRGFGGIQISDDGNELWVMNLYQKELLKFNLNNLAAGPTRYPVPNPGCVGGTYRPWSVKLRDGKVFVGVVCDAST